MPDHQLFQNVNKIFLKGVSSISCQGPCRPILEKEGNVLLAESAFGKGKVIAVGDPWLYNEYINHLYLPADFDNYTAAKNLVKILIDNKL